jgi:hypothetical protein
MGRIKNRRDMESTLQALKQKAERDRAKQSSKAYSQSDQKTLAPVKEEA